MKTLAPALLVIAVLAGGCSGGSPTTAPTTSSTDATPAEVPDEGQPAPDALRSFTCRADSEGTWNAEGRLANPSKSSHTYAVTGQVGPADGEPASAKRVEVTVGPRSTETFLIPKLPTSDPDGPCHLRVIVID